MQPRPEKRLNDGLVARLLPGATPPTAFHTIPFPQHPLMLPAMVGGMEP
jgi:hypothetical protein